MRPMAAWGRPWPSSTSEITSAPALISGLRGMPCSCSSRTMELNREPEGSRPTRFHRSAPSFSRAMVRVNTLEMLWMEKAVAASPAA